MSAAHVYASFSQPWYKKVRYACLYLVLSSTDQELTQQVSEMTSEVSEQDVGETTLNCWFGIQGKKHSQKIKLHFQKKARLENVTWPKEFENYSENFRGD